LSEDYSFCLRWRKIGGEIWIDGKSKLTHCGTYEFVGELGGGGCNAERLFCERVSRPSRGAWRGGSAR
jgi:hypothetical protein